MHLNDKTNIKTRRPKAYFRVVSNLFLQICKRLLSERGENARSIPKLESAKFP